MEIKRIKKEKYEIIKNIDYMFCKLENQKDYCYNTFNRQIELLNKYSLKATKKDFKVGEKINFLYQEKKQSGKYVRYSIFYNAIAEKTEEIEKITDIYIFNKYGQRFKKEKILYILEK